MWAQSFFFHYWFISNCHGHSVKCDSLSGRCQVERNVQWKRCIFIYSKCNGFYLLQFEGIALSTWVLLKFWLYSVVYEYVCAHVTCVDLDRRCNTAYLSKLLLKVEIYYIFLPFFLNLYSTWQNIQFLNTDSFLENKSIIVAVN